MVGHSTVYRGLHFGKRRSLADTLWSSLFSLSRPQPGWHRTGTSDAVVLRQLLHFVGRRSVSSTTRIDTRGKTHTHGDARPPAGRVGSDQVIRGDSENPQYARP